MLSSIFNCIEQKYNYERSNNFPKNDDQYVLNIHRDICEILKNYSLLQ